MTELTHFGVPGMKWGHRKAAAPTSGSQPTKTRQELRALNKASRKADVAARDKSIDEARARVASGNQAYKDAKAKYKADKMLVGRREAAKAFNKVKDQRAADIELSSQAKSGKETTRAVLIAVASGLVSGLISA